MKTVYRTLFAALFMFPMMAHSISNGFYVGGQIGRADTNIPKLKESQVSSDIATLINVTPGNTFNFPSAPPIVIESAFLDFVSLGPLSSSVDDNPIAGRIFMGYQFLPQLAIELGYLHLRDQNSSYTSNSVISVSGTVAATAGSLAYTTNFNSVTRHDSYSENALDLNVKAIVPTCSNFNIYAKVGVAYMRIIKKSQLTLEDPTELIIDGTLTPGASAVITTTDSSRTYQLSPTLGIGAAYSFGNDLDVDLSWYRVISRSNVINNIDMLFLGFNYRFDWLLDWSSSCGFGNS